MADQANPQSLAPWHPHPADTGVLEIRLDDVNEVSRYSQLMAFG